MQRHAHDVDRRVEQVRVDECQEPADRIVAGDDVEVGVEHEGGPRIVGGEHEVERVEQPAHRGHVGTAVVVGRSVTSAEQHLVAVPQGDLECLRQPQHHLPARQRPPGFQVGQVARRGGRQVGEVELAEAPPLPPLPQQQPRDVSPCRRRRHAGDARTVKGRGP